MAEPNAWERKVTRALMPTILRECACCGSLEERVWEDSWTGLELCQQCLSTIVGQVTNSPATEGDNLRQLVAEERG